MKVYTLRFQFFSGTSEEHRFIAVSDEGAIRQSYNHIFDAEEDEEEFFDVTLLNPKHREVLPHNGEWLARISLP